VVLEHQLLNGALLLFAFFMISDPMTSPNHPRARAMHSALVAAIAFTWQFGFYAHNGMLWALFLAAPMVPMWDALWPAPKYEWTQSGGKYEHAEDEAMGSAARDAGGVRNRAAA
jgi:Na+-translocating ferredoxin:NAD+ oxidoreductase RnfD subunit